MKTTILSSKTNSSRTDPGQPEVKCRRKAHWNQERQSRKRDGAQEITALGVQDGRQGARKKGTRDWTGRSQSHGGRWTGPLGLGVTSASPSWFKGKAREGQSVPTDG